MSFLWLLIPVVVLAGIVFYFRRREKPYFGLEDDSPKPTDKIEIIRSNGNNKDYKCGHKGPKSYVVSVYGEESREISDDKRCPECFISWMSPVVIRCALCRLPIWPGEGVALYHKSNSGLHTDIGYKVGDNYLGCMRWDCCLSGAFYGGNWDGVQFKPAFGGAVMAAAVFESGKPMVVGDVSRGDVIVLDDSQEDEEGAT